MLIKRTRRTAFSILSAAVVSISLTAAANPVPPSPWILEAWFSVGKTYELTPKEVKNDFQYRTNLETNIYLYHLKGFSPEFKQAELLRSEAGKNDFKAIQKVEIKPPTYRRKRTHYPTRLATLLDKNPPVNKKLDYKVHILDANGKVLGKSGVLKILSPPQLLFRLQKNPNMILLDMKILSKKNYSNSIFHFSNPRNYTPPSQPITSQGGKWAIPLPPALNQMSWPVFEFKPKLPKYSWNYLEGTQIVNNDKIFYLKNFLHDIYRLAELELEPGKKYSPQVRASLGKGRLIFPGNSQNLKVFKYEKGNWEAPTAYKVFLLKLDKKNKIIQVQKKEKNELKTISDEEYKRNVRSGTVPQYYDHPEHPGAWISATWKNVSPQKSTINKYKITDYSTKKLAPVILSTSFYRQTPWALTAQVTANNTVKLKLPECPIKAVYWETEPQWQVFRVNEKFQSPPLSAKLVYSGKAQATEITDSNLKPGEVYRYDLKLDGKQKRYSYILGKGQQTTPLTTHSYRNFNACRVLISPKTLPTVAVWSESATYQPLAEKIKADLKKRGMVILERGKFNAISQERNLGQNSPGNHKLLGAEFTVVINQSYTPQLKITRQAQVWPFTKNYNLKDMAIKKTGKILSFDDNKLLELIANHIGTFQAPPKSPTAQPKGVTQKPDRDLKIAILPFQETPYPSRSPQPSQKIDSALSSRATSDLAFLALTETEGIELLEREQLNKIIAEQNLQFSGKLSQQQMLNIGQLLSADYLLAGSFSTDGRNFQMNLRLISVNTSEIPESKQVRGKIDTAPKNIIAATRTMLKKQISSIEVNRVPKQAVKMAEALDIIRKSHLSKNSKDRILKTMAKYQTAVMLAPDFPPVLEKMAQACMYLAEVDPQQATNHYRKAILYAQKGLKNSNGWEKAKIAVLLGEAALALKDQKTVSQALDLIETNTQNQSLDYLYPMRTMLQAGCLADESGNINKAIYFWLRLVKECDPLTDFGFSIMNQQRFHADIVATLYHTVIQKLPQLPKEKRQKILMAFAKRIAPDYPNLALCALELYEKDGTTSLSSLLKSQINLYFLQDTSQAMKELDLLLQQTDLSADSKARALYLQAIAKQFTGDNTQAQKLYDQAAKTAPSLPLAKEAKIRSDSIKNLSQPAPQEVTKKISRLPFASKDEAAKIIQSLEPYSYHEKILKLLFTPQAVLKTGPKPLIKFITRYFWGKRKLPPVSDHRFQIASFLLMKLRHESEQHPYTPESITPLRKLKMAGNAQRMSRFPILYHNRRNKANRSKLTPVSGPDKLGFPGWGLPTLQSRSPFHYFHFRNREKSIIVDDMVITTAFDGCLYALKPGKQEPIWQKLIFPPIANAYLNPYSFQLINSQLKQANNKILLTLKNGVMMLLDNKNGKIIWRKQLPGILAGNTPIKITDSSISCPIADQNEILNMFARRHFSKNKKMTIQQFDLKNGSLLPQDEKTESMTATKAKSRTNTLPDYPEPIKGLVHRIPVLSCADNIIGFNKEYIIWENDGIIFYGKLADFQKKPYTKGFQLTPENIQEIINYPKRRNNKKSTAKPELRKALNKLAQSRHFHSDFKGFFRQLNEESAKGLLEKTSEQQNRYAFSESDLRKLGYMGEACIEKRNKTK